MCRLAGKHSSDTPSYPTYCLLTPLMSPKDKKCKLMDGFIDGLID